MITAMKKPLAQRRLQNNDEESSPLVESIETAIDERDRLWTDLTAATDPLPERLDKLAALNSQVRENLSVAPALTATRVHLEIARCKVCEAFLARCAEEGEVAA
jgi:cytidylate kinase